MSRTVLKLSILLRNKIKNSIQLLLILQQKPHLPLLVFMPVLYPDQIGICRCCFFVDREKPSKQGQNQQQTQLTFNSTVPELNTEHVGWKHGLLPLVTPSPARNMKTTYL